MISDGDPRLPAVDGNVTIEALEISHCCLFIGFEFSPTLSKTITSLP
jgi:hypothetical protein